MANFDPQEQFDLLKDKVVDAYKNALNVKEGDVEVKVENIRVEDTKEADDISKQKRAIQMGVDWTVPVKAKLTLFRKGKKVESDDVIVGHVPKLTDRYGYIVGGNEYQSMNLLRLRPGVYHRRAQNGALYGEFNLGNREQFLKGKSLKVNFDPEKKKMYMLASGTRKFALVPLLRAAGVSDERMKQELGDAIFESSNAMEKKEGSTVKKIHQIATGKEASSLDEALTTFKGLLDRTVLDKETTQTTLERGVDKIDGEVLLKSAKRLIDMAKGVDDGDDKGSLQFLSIHSADDLISNRIKETAFRNKRKMLFRLKNSKKTLKQAVPVREFDKAIRGFFNTSLASQGDQTNPLEMLSGHRKTTLMGEQGGIQSPFAILEESKLVNPSHFGYLDPIQTPESEKTGVSLALSLGARKDGNRIKSKYIKPKDNSTVELTPAQAVDSMVALPDQYVKKGKKMVPIGEKVQAFKKGEILSVDPKEVEYILPSPRGIFSAASNLIPFLQNNQGNRAMTAVRQQEQAVPLVNREAPLVQVKSDGKESFEKVFGEFASSVAPESGKVTKVTADEITIKKGRKSYKVPLYNNYPLKGHTVYHSTPRVKKGDTVKKGDLLADSTFTKDGKLALGTNLQVAYMPYKGYNFEDGIVISESAAKKLASEHLHSKSSMSKGGDIIIDKKKYINLYPTEFKKAQIQNIDSDGIVRVGAEVKPGDPLILKLKRPEKTEMLRKRQLFMKKKDPLKYRNRALVWKKDNGGIVTDVVKKRNGEVVVYVKTKEPATEGDKLVARHGNKGIITKILPDNEMPYKKNKDGSKVRSEILLNPVGVPGRINLGQILETVAGKIADDKGSAYEVKNFEPNKNYLESLKKELKDAGLTDKEPLINPDTGKPYLEDVLFGKQYIFKLKHQVQKKMNARSGGPAMPYNINHEPTSGPSGGNTLGELGLYALLAHGARKNIHDMFAYKTTQNDDLWEAVREGRPIPAPKTPFAFEKFLGYLNAMRVNVKKEGNHLQLMPFTEDQISGKGGFSNGELKNPSLVLKGKNLEEYSGGIFDPIITGGSDGKRWSHFTLAEEIPNPLFEDAIIKLLNIKKSEYEELVNGKKFVNGKTGGEAIKSMLSKINVKKELKEHTELLKKRKNKERDKVYKKVKILRALNELDQDPTIYMMKSVPVLPPHFRPITVKENGDLSSNDLNGLYKDVGAVNEVFTMQKEIGLPEEFLADQRKSLYNGVKAIMGLGGSLTRKGEYRGIVDLVSGITRKATTGKRDGGSGKEGFFHKALLKRRQDLSARSTIIPEPRMGFDELGMPEDMAWTLYEPFIERSLRRAGYNSEQAQKLIKQKATIAEKALNSAVEKRPVLLKRDPALHKFNIMAFKPRLVKGKALEIHPLTVEGFNADFDGDTMAVYVPLTEGAVKEAHGMFPSNNLFSPTTGAIQYTPGHEALLGLYLASKTGKQTNKSYTSKQKALRDWKKGTLGYTDAIKVKGAETTIARLEIENTLPKQLRETGRKKLKDMTVFNKDALKNALTIVAKEHPQKYGEVANTLKDIGNRYTTELGYSIGLDDFSVVNAEIRDSLIAKANKEADKIRKSEKNLQKRHEKIVTVFNAVDNKLDKINTKTLGENPTNIYRMVTSGARGKPEQLKQIVSSPLLLKDARDRTIPYLVPRSYSEGMDIGSYWTTMHGARKGTIQKVQGVRDPGYITKQLQQSVMNIVVTERDCGTNEGIDMSLDELDVLDRRIATPINAKGLRLGKNTLMTPNVKGMLKKVGIKSIKVRSALRCEASDGVCQMCTGQDISKGGGKMQIGTNVGVISAHSVGEPTTQLSLNTFHTGGLAKGKASKSQSMFKNLSDLLRIPKKFPNKATLADLNGTVTQIEDAPQGGKNIFVNKKLHYVPVTNMPDVKIGDTIKRGDKLSDGLTSPRELLQKTNIVKTQDVLTDEVLGLLKQADKGIRRRNVEVVVKAMTGFTKVEDPSKNKDVLPGDIIPLTKVRGYNKKHPKAPMIHTPVVTGINVLPHELGEDWMARMGFQNIGRTVTEAVREGWKTNIHGFHPVPAAAFAKEFGIKSKIGAEEWRGQY